ncbi:MAG: UDP-N-acetylmuramoyl-L-alanine--D-glutamate ligase [Clostridia bacterium]
MNLETYYNYIDGKTVTFCGIGRSNMPLIEMFAKKGAIVSARDKNKNLGENIEILKNLGVKMYLGENYLENLTEDIIFRAPGMPYFMPELQKAIKNGQTVTSEIETFFELCPCKIYAITGSDGKTTTTSIIADMLKKQGNRVHLGGNIGRPLLPIIEDVSKYDYAVVELSSFQLISMKKSPDVAVMTNLAPNHLDVHKDMKEYVDAKRNIYLHQNSSSKIVLNMDNDITRSFKDDVKSELWSFSMKETPSRGAYCKNGEIFVNGKKTMNETDIKLEGKHNVENFLAAISAVWGDVSPDNVIATARTFGGVPHRCEFVKKVAGVKYYNDSIASSPSRVLSGTLAMYDKKIIMIAGGADKNVGFDELGHKICDKTKVLILIKPEEQIDGFKPSAADKISLSVRKSHKYMLNYPVIIRVTCMEDAVAAAHEIAKDGDIVSLSPACTSFDMYQNFEVRGNHYKEIVNKL